jgi:hypothetical protein
MRRAGRAAGLALALALALVAGLAGVAAVAEPARRAVIFLDEQVTEYERMFQSPRILLEKAYYEDLGYEVTLWRASDGDIVQALLNPAIAAVSFFGHGYDPTAPEATSSMLFVDANGWSDRIFSALRQGYIDAGMSGQAATARARDESKNVKLDVLRNHSCASLVDTRLAEALVRPGGSYFGVRGLYAPCPTPMQLIQDVSFLLEEYVVPRAGPRPVPGPAAPGYYPTAPGGPCAVDLGPAGGCGPGMEFGCIPCPNADQGIMQWYIPPTP